MAKEKKNRKEYWDNWVRETRRNKAWEEHIHAARQAWDDYEGGRRESSSEDKGRRQSCLYWSAVKTMEPAFYARTPRIVAEHRFGTSDPVALLASLIGERLGQYCVSEVDFDGVMTAVVGDFIHADKATTQVVYKVETVEAEQYLLVDEAGNYVTEAGAPYTGDVRIDEDGNAIGTVEQIDEDSQQILLCSASFDDVLHTPTARCASEIREMAFRFWLSRDEAEERFKGKEIRWKTERGEKGDEGDDDENTLGEFVEGWECYDKETETVYWYTDQCDDLLDVQPDPYKLKGFFPSPFFIIGSKPHGSLFPIAAHTKLRKGTLGNLNRAMRQIPKLIDAIRRRAIVDGPPELLDALTRLDSADFIVCPDLGKHILDKGGIANIIHYVPVEPLVAALTEVNNLKAEFKAEFYEYFGVPDILRGITDPMEAAATNRLNMQAAHDRFKFMKKQVSRLAADSIRMMVDLALQVFSDGKIARIVGYDYLEFEQQSLFPEALALLRDDSERLIRLDIETDSMTFADDLNRQAETKVLMEVVSNGLQNVSAMLQISPAFASVALQLVLEGMGTVTVGKTIQGKVKQAVEALLKQVQEQQANQPPPAPDYEAMKIQLENQKLMFEGQRLQIEAQQKEREMSQEDVRNQIKSIEVSNKNAIENLWVSMEAQKQRFVEMLEQVRLGIEAKKADAQITEGQMEEVRLAREADYAGQASLLDAAKPVESETKTPGVTINIGQQPEPAIVPVPVLPGGGEVL